MSVENAPPVEMDDVMLAMDVVDTLRHSSRVVERELDADGQDQRLLERLKNIYATQGIDVPDHILREGVEALREDRFKYTPTPRTFSRKLAEFYVNGFSSAGKIRRRFPLKNILLFGLCAYLAFFIILNFGVLFPGGEVYEKQRYTEAAQKLPGDLRALYDRIASLTDNDQILDRANSYYKASSAALWAKDVNGALADKAKMEELAKKLTTEYDLRIVSVQGQETGIWRNPDTNPNAKNYYILVEPVRSNGNIFSIDVVNQENNKKVSSSKFGVRVPKSTFDDIFADKKDDGIIQNNIIGSKQRGELDVNYNMPVLQGRITEW